MSLLFYFFIFLKVKFIIYYIIYNRLLFYNISLINDILMITLLNNNISIIFGFVSREFILYLDHRFQVLFSIITKLYKLFL